MSAFEVVGPAGSGGWVSLDDQLLAIDTATFDFTSIPGTYKHLNLLVSGRGTKSDTNCKVNLRFNNDSGSNYDWERRYSSGSDGGNGVAQIQVCEFPAASVASQYAGSVEALVSNYAETVFNKQVVALGGRIGSTDASQNNITMTYAAWRNTVAVTRITILPDSGSWVAGSRATLYGLS